MALAIHSTTNFQSDSAWPSFWPPVKLPPPPPLSQAASSIWSPKLTAAAPTADPSGSLYSVQLRQSGQTAPADPSGGFQMDFLDQRIALVRFDASHAGQSAQSTVSAVAA